MAKKYLYGRNALLRGTIADFQSAALRATLVQPASTYLTEDPTTMAGFSLLSELTAAQNKTIANVLVVPNTTRKIVYVTADDPAWTGLTLNEVIAGLVVYLFVGAFATSIPLWGITRPIQYTITASGLFTWEWNDDGVAEA